MALVAELSHRCPLQCPYCSNPLKLEGASSEIGTEDWQRIIAEAASLGILQIHFSGGEPLVRRDLADLVRAAAQAGIYTNLITSGIGLDAARAQELAAARLDHIQLSFQDSRAAENDRMAGMAGAFAKKHEAARAIALANLPLTANFVVYRDNILRVAEMIALGVEIGASRIEIANVQYHGWAFKNRADLMPDRAGLEAATAAVEEARTALRGRCVIDYVLPDYFAKTPKACMGGWGQRMMVVTPSGLALPCHAAQSITGLTFPDLKTQSLVQAWHESAAFAAYRGTDWMAAPCRTCPDREKDFGGCRCQAMALLGDAAATDPVCQYSPQHEMLEPWRAEPALHELRFRRAGRHA
jgi:pyrroloquinoline quinone biosynthesis protein E